VPIVGVAGMRLVDEVAGVVCGVVVDGDVIRRAFHHCGLLEGEVGQPPHHDLLHRLRVMAVGDRVQEPETKLEMDECSVEPRHHQMLM
jgi:hypothetical protein